MKFLIIFMMFFILGGLFIISNNNLAMCERDNLSEFSGFYSDWLNQVYSNVQTITGEIVKLDWFPSNSSSHK